MTVSREYKWASSLPYHQSAPRHEAEGPTAPPHAGLNKIALMGLCFIVFICVFCFPALFLHYSNFSRGHFLITHSYLISHLKFWFWRTQTNTVRMPMYIKRGWLSAVKKVHLIDFLCCIAAGKIYLCVLYFWYHENNHSECTTHCSLIVILLSHFSYENC